MSNPFWINDPQLLINFKTPLIPNNSQSCEDNLNAITRGVIFLSLLGLIITESLSYLISGILTILLLIFIYYHKKKTEYYENMGGNMNFKKNKLKPNTTNPTNANPLMNVMLPELNVNPTRNQGDKSFLPEVKENINEKVKEDIISKNDLDQRLFKDLGDEMQFDHSMRQFYTTANSRVANDQKGFLDYCYGDMKSCKEDNNHCTGNIPTYNQLT